MRITRNKIIAVIAIVCSVFLVQTIGRNASRKSKNSFSALRKKVQQQWFIYKKKYYHLFYDKTFLPVSNLSQCRNSFSDTLCRKEINSTNNPPERLKSFSPYKFCIDSDKKR